MSGKRAATHLWGAAAAHCSGKRTSCIQQNCPPRLGTVCGQCLLCEMSRVGEHRPIKSGTYNNYAHMLKQIHAWSQHTSLWPKLAYARTCASGKGKGNPVDNKFLHTYLGRPVGSSAPIACASGLFLLLLFPRRFFFCLPSYACDYASWRRSYNVIRSPRRSMVRFRMGVILV